MRHKQCPWCRTQEQDQTGDHWYGGLRPPMTTVNWKKCGGGRQIRATMCPKVTPVFQKKQKAKAYQDYGSSRRCMQQRCDWATGKCDDATSTKKQQYMVATRAFGRASKQASHLQRARILCLLARPKNRGDTVRVLPDIK